MENFFSVVVACIMCECERERERERESKEDNGREEEKEKYIPGGEDKACSFPVLITNGQTNLTNFIKGHYHHRSFLLEVLLRMMELTMHLP